MAHDLSLGDADMCHRRAHALAKLPFFELLDRYSGAHLRRADDLKKRDIARVARLHDNADEHCAAAEHRKGFITSYREEIERRLTS